MKKRYFRKIHISTVFKKQIHTVLPATALIAVMCFGFLGQAGAFSSGSLLVKAASDGFGVYTNGNGEIAQKFLDNSLLNVKTAGEAPDGDPQTNYLPPYMKEEDSTVPEDPENTVLPDSGETYDDLPEGVQPVKSIDLTPVDPEGYLCAGNVYVKNDTKYTIDVPYLLGRGFTYDMKGSGVQILILHTHGTEAYSPEGHDFYEPSLENARSEDTNQNVVSVGSELEKVLKARGYQVIHDKTMHDKNGFNSSYSNALTAIGKYVRDNPSIKIIIDVHRDAIVDKSEVKYRPVTEINGKSAAQVMLVIGTPESGLKHPNWKENLKLALKIQKEMTDTYPSFARPITIKPGRYNEHVTDGSLLVEIGSDANTLEQAKYSARLFGENLANVLDRMK